MPPDLIDAVAVEDILDDTRVRVWQFDIAARQMTAAGMAGAQLGGVAPADLRGA